MPNATINAETRKAYDTQKKRRTYPKDYFLLIDENGDRKFPVKNPKTGKYDAGLVRAAITRAAQYGYKEVEQKAQELYKREFSPKKDFGLEIIAKDEKSGKEVFGIVLEPDKKDGEGDSFSKEAIKEGCYKFNKDFLNQTYRHQHFLTKDKVSIIESYVAPADFKLGDKVVKEGTWLMRSKIDDPEIQKDVREGVIKGFSIGGYGE